jgi:hypothetical protein
MRSINSYVTPPQRDKSLCARLHSSIPSRTSAWVHLLQWSENCADEKPDCSSGPRLSQTRSSATPKARWSHGALSQVAVLVSSPLVRSKVSSSPALLPTSRSSVSSTSARSTSAMAITEVSQLLKCARSRARLLIRVPLPFLSFVCRHPSNRL